MSFLLGEAGGVTKRDVEALTRRERFSDFLPYARYDAGEGRYETIDDCHAYLWEISPVAFASESVVTAMTGLLNIKFPAGVVAQFILYADPYIGDILSDYVATKTRDDPLVKANVASFVSHLLKNQDGMEQLNGIPVRNFRAFVAVKSKEKLSQDILSVTHEALTRFGVRSVPAAGDDGLIALLRRFFSDMRKSRTGVYDEERPIRKQVIDAGQPIIFDGPLARFGSHYGRCLTPQALKKETDASTVNRLFGGMMGLVDDSEQINGPFLFCVNVIFGDVAVELHAKSQVVTAQKAGGAIAAQIAKRTEEMHWALDVLQNEKFVRIIPIMWVFGWSETEVRDSVSRVSRLFESEQFAMQEESYLNKVLFLSALPFGLYTEAQNIRTMERDFTMPASSAAVLLPVQGDYRGAGKPVQVFVGRKGQIVSFDLFDPRMNNHNFLVAAEPGAGKSFLLNNLTYQYYAANAANRIIDIGYSYEKNCRLLGGRFIDVGDEQIVLNPFDVEGGDREDQDLATQTAADVLALMATSAAGKSLDEADINLLKSAARWVFQDGRLKQGVDAAREYLATYPEHAPKVEESATNILKDRAHMLAFNLQSFCTEGEYGRFFNGPSTLNIRSDDFVVLELERLRNYKQLFSVVVMQVLNAVTQDLYLSERDRPRFILFDEAAAFLKQSLAGGLTTSFASVIEAGYRRARKYRGSFGAVIQSIMDIESFGDVGRVLVDNSATRIFGQSQAYQAAAEKRIIPYDGFALKLLQSVHNNKPKYSEMFFDTPFGCGVARLVVDPHSYWINTSAPEDVAAFNRLVQIGLTPAQAIDALVEGRAEAILAKRIEGPDPSRVAAE